MVSKPSSKSIIAMVAAAAVLGACANTTEGAADDGQSYFDGKTIEIMVPASPGGGSDNAARLLERFLPDELEGSVSLQVVNRDGAGAQIPTNEWLQQGGDGTAMTVMSGSGLIPWLVDDDMVEYDPAAMHLVWAQPAGRAIIAAASTGVEAPADLLTPTEPLIFGGRTPTGADLLTVLGFEILNLREDIQEIWGYDGGGATSTAFEQGEVTLNAAQPGRLLGPDSHLIDDGVGTVVYTHGNVVDGQMGPDSLMPDAPTIEDAYAELHGESPSGEDWETFLTVNELVSAAQWSLYMHPDAPDEAVTEVREAIQRVLASDEYQEAAVPIVGDDPALDASGIESYSMALQSVDDSLVARLSSFLQENYIDELE